MRRSPARKVDEMYVFEAHHPQAYVSIAEWFHFSDKDHDGYKLRVSGTNILDCLNEMGEKLYPGVERVFRDQWSVENVKERLFTHLFIAFCYGGYYPGNVGVDVWRANAAGRKLLNRNT